MPPLRPSGPLVQCTAPVASPSGLVGFRFCFHRRGLGLLWLASPAQCLGNPGTGWSPRPPLREAGKAPREGHLGEPRGTLASRGKKCISVADTCGALYVNCPSAAQEEDK